MAKDWRLIASSFFASAYRAHHNGLVTALLHRKSLVGARKRAAKCGRMRNPACLQRFYACGELREHLRILGSWT